MPDFELPQIYVPGSELDPIEVRHKPEREDPLAPTIGRIIQLREFPINRPASDESRYHTDFENPKST